MALKLEIFEPVSQAEPVSAAVLLTEDDCLAAFDKGYAAGWEDAAAAEEAGQARLRVELAHRLADIGFTYAEARREILAAIRPLVEAMTGTVVPAIAREVLCPMVAGAIEAMARDLVPGTLTIRAHPDDLPGLADFLASNVELPFDVEADASLAPGLVALAAPDREALVDLPAAIRTMSAAVRDYFLTEPEMRDHG